MKAYVYYIGWTKLNKHYIGIRKSEVNDLWIKYFTSSKMVKKYRKIYGEPDVIKIIEWVSSYDEAIKKEATLLTEFNAAENDDWLNRTNGNKNFFCKGHCEETKAKISNKHKGMKRTETTRKNISNALKGQKIPEEVKKKFSKSAKKRANTIEGRLRMIEASRISNLEANAKKRKEKIANVCGVPLKIIDSKGEEKYFNTSREAAKYYNMSPSMMLYYSKKKYIKKLDLVVEKC